MVKNFKIHILFLAMAILLGGCASDTTTYGGGDYHSQVRRIKQQGGVYKIGKPYKINGTWYYPKEDYRYSEVGIASWYGSDFHNKKTANGEKYDMNTITAAHRTLPLPSVVKVTNLENGRSLIVRVNDRGPYAKNRIIDISKKGAALLGYQTQGTAKVKVEIMEKESKMLKNALLGKEMPKNSYTIAQAKPAVDKAAVKKNVVADNNQNGKKQFYVQAGSFSQEILARELKNKLSKFGNSKVAEADVNNATFYRVRLGPYSDENTASKALAKVRDYGLYEAKLVND